MLEKTDLTPNRPDFWTSVLDPVRHFGERVAEFFAPSSDGASTADSYEINLEIPGVDEDDIDVEIQEGRLVVSGEKKAAQEKTGKDYYFSERLYGRFQRVFRLPDDADGEKIEATYRNGVLRIVVGRKASTGETPRRVQIKHG